MSYQVIARKWRPQVFNELIGQTHISQTLINALRNDRVPHALLFTGPRGTGKTSTARIFAKSVRCQNAKDFVPCNTCSDCEDIANSRSMDVIEIDGASNNGVDAIRELRDTVAYQPATGRYKVYIIDEVHMLSSSAFNALLKTLEEPPEHVLFIMATTEVQKIPNTVLSRCQRYDFRKISTRLIAEHLAEICRQEKVKAENEALWAIARQGEGSMRDSQSLLDQVISFCAGDLSLARVTEVLGLTDRNLLLDTLTALIQRSTDNIVQVIEKVFTAGYDPSIFMKDFLEELRHLLLVKVAPTKAAEVIDLPLEEIEKLKGLAAQLGEEDIHLLFDMALKGAQDLHRAQDTRIVLEMILLRMSVAPRVQNLLNLKSAGVGTISGTSTTSAPNTAPLNTTSAAASPKRETASSAATTPPARATTPPTPTEETGHTAPPPPAAPATGSLDEKWNDFVDRVRKVNGLIAAKLDQLHLSDLNGQSLKIGVPEKYKFLYSQVTDAGFEKKLVNYLNTFWGPGHQVEIAMINPKSAGTLSPTQLQEKKTSDEKAAIRKQVEEHPLVRQAKSIFNTEIKSIREEQ